MESFQTSHGRSELWQESKIVLFGSDRRLFFHNSNLFLRLFPLQLLFSLLHFLSLHFESFPFRDNLESSLVVGKDFQDTLSPRLKQFLSVLPSFTVALHVDVESSFLCLTPWEHALNHVSQFLLFVLERGFLVLEHFWVANQVLVNVSRLQKRVLFGRH